MSWILCTQIFKSKVCVGVWVLEYACNPRTGKEETDVSMGLAGQSSLLADSQASDCLKKRRAMSEHGHLRLCSGLHMHVHTCMYTHALAPIPIIRTHAHKGEKTA